MNLYKRVMIFLTFIVACISITLMAAAMGTTYWVTSKARRSANPSESDGFVHFGLFQGEKELNVAYGWRTYYIRVLDLLHDDIDFMIYSYWLSTVASLCMSLFFSATTAVFAVINTATTPISSFSGIPGLYLWHILTILFQTSAISFWVAQFYKKLQFNVMSLEDRSNLWVSDGMASFGHSFWFVVAALVINILGILSIFFGTKESRERSAALPVMEEKGNGAIMLY